ncbi:MAG: protein kinase [Rhodobacterales bacterium]|nr:protein kinase [Rhodobacterales bacterium]
MAVGRRRFRIIKEIAEGGFGKVYLAEQISTDGFSRIVAVKLLHAKWSSHDEVVMRTRDEARLLGLIRHQHIVKVEDLTAIDGKCAIVMEYLEGVDLKWMGSYLKERGQIFPRASLFEIMLACASALDAAYNGTPLQGGSPLQVIHRDIKPSNIFITISGGIKVLDFGTARANFAEREAKTQALAFGSQGYMAPERMLGEEDTPAADIFSLGVTLYELLAQESYGRIPPRPNKFATKRTELIAALSLDGAPEWCDQIRETLGLMLSYDPEDRPTAAQLVEIMELLAQESDGTGLRKFCRTLVADAKQHLPELDTGDPLAGTIVDEDASRSFPMDSAGNPPASFANQPSVPMGFGATPAPMGASQAGPHGADGPSGPLGVGRDVSAPMVSSNGGSGKIFMAVGALILLGGVVFVVAAGAGLFFYNSAAEEVPADVVDAVEPSASAPIPSAQPEEPAVGGRIVSEDGREGISEAVTVVKYSDSAGGAITIKGGDGFVAEWDGKADFDLGPLGEGRYSTIITPAGGKKIRGKSFTIEANKRSCEFSFDVVSNAWDGGGK